MAKHMQRFNPHYNTSIKNGTKNCFDYAKYIKLTRLNLLIMRIYILKIGPMLIGAKLVTLS